jgi:hypothetical protein
LEGLEPIAPGDYDGQPVKWNGAEYVPLALGDALVLAALASDGLFTIQSGDTMQLIAAGAGGMLFQADAAGFNLSTTDGEFSLNVGSGLGILNLTSLGLALEAVALSLRTGDLQQVLSLSAGLAQLAGAVVQLNDATSASILTVDDEQIRAQSPGGTFVFDTDGLRFNAAKIGFFGTDPVVPPTITGATTQLQVDSLVSALVVLGLVTDGR